MTWLADHGVGRKAHSLIATPPKKVTRRDPSVMGPGPRALDPHRPFSSPSTTFYSKAHKLQEYEPALGFSQFFWHQYRLSLWIRHREHRQFQGDFMPASLIEAKMYCLGGTTAPIKALIKEASLAYQKRKQSKTTIRRPAPHKQRKEGGNPWKRATMRPSRPLDTVVIENSQKEHIVSEIQEYIRPDSRR